MAFLFVREGIGFAPETRVFKHGTGFTVATPPRIERLKSPTVTVWK